MKVDKKILVVDDEPHILRSVEYILSREGYTVLTATNGEEGIQVAKAEKPDLILLDIMIPKIDGYQVCRMLKSDPHMGEVYIIMLTAKGQDVDRVIGFESGADDYIGKPFSPKKLLAMAREVLERPKMEG